MMTDTNEKLSERLYRRAREMHTLTFEDVREVIKLEERIAELEKKLAEAMEYAQQRGWPGKPMLTRRECVEMCAEALVKSEREAWGYDEGRHVGVGSVLQISNWEQELEAYHELALLMDKEREEKAAKTDSDYVRISTLVRRELWEEYKRGDAGLGAILENPIEAEE